MTLKVNVALSRKDLYALTNMLAGKVKSVDEAAVHERLKQALAKIERLHADKASKANTFKHESRVIVQGTMTGRFSAPFNFPYGGASLPKKLGDLPPMADVDYSKLEERVLAHYAEAAPHVAKVASMTKEVMLSREASPRPASPKNEYLGRKKR